MDMAMATEECQPKKWLQDQLYESFAFFFLNFSFDIYVFFFYRTSSSVFFRM